MNMLVKPVRTPAETALIDAFGERCRCCRATGGDGQARQCSRDAEVRPADQAYRAWALHRPQAPVTAVPAHDTGNNARPVEALIEGSTVLTVLNGVATASACCRRIA